MVETEAVALEPCPKCGGEAKGRSVQATEFDDDFIVRCTKCGLQTKQHCFPHLALEDWNTRASITRSSGEVTPAMIEAGKRAYTDWQQSLDPHTGSLFEAIYPAMREAQHKGGEL